MLNVVAAAFVIVAVFVCLPPYVASLFTSRNDVAELPRVDAEPHDPPAADVGSGDVRELQSHTDPLAKPRDVPGQKEGPRQLQESRPVTTTVLPSFSIRRAHDHATIDLAMKCNSYITIVPREQVCHRGENCVARRKSGNRFEGSLRVLEDCEGSCHLGEGY